MDNEQLIRIRRAEARAHTEMYAAQPLYTGGGWLAKPVRATAELLPLFDAYTQLRILDLGAGVGRNCLPFAERYQNIDCRIDCVDILPLANTLLRQNAAARGVEDHICSTTSALEDFCIRPAAYDLILAVSALEHVAGEALFWRTLAAIRDGLRPGGVVCLVINTNISEKDKVTGEALVPQFEVTLSGQALTARLQELFDGWQVLKNTQTHQRYDIPRAGCTAVLDTDVVTFIARRPR